MGHNEDQQSTLLLSLKDQAACHYDQGKQCLPGAECEHIQWAQLPADHSSCSQKRALTRDLRRNEWVSSYACLWAHSRERQQGEDYDCLRETIFPIPNFMGHTLFSSHGMGGRFFSMHSQIALFQQVWYILPPIHSRKLPRTCKASWDFQQSSRGTQSLAGSGGQKTTTGGEVLHRANNLNHLMIVYHSAIIPILGTTSPLIL